MNKLVVAIALSALLTACGSTAPDATETTTTTTRAPRITDNSGRPDITFDPCLDIPDDLMNAAGYNAAKKELSDMPMGDYTFLACTYDNRSTADEVGYMSIFTILSGNVTLEEEFQKNSHISRHTSINGRPALIRAEPASEELCTYVLGTDFGIVILRRSDGARYGHRSPLADSCDAALAVVTDIEPFVESPYSEK